MIAVLSSQIEKASKPKKPKATKVVGRGHGFKGSHDIEIAAGDGDQEAEAQIAFVRSPDLVRSPNLQPGPHFKDTNAQKWHLFVMKLQEQSRLSLLGSLKNLPNFVGSAFDAAEAKLGAKFTPEDRKLCYHEFCRKSANLGILHSSDIEELLCSHPQLGVQLPLPEIRSLIHEKFGSGVKNLAELNPTTERDCDSFGFDVFVSVLAAARQLSDTRAKMRGWSIKAILLTALPIDPYSAAEQAEMRGKYRATL